MEIKKAGWLWVLLIALIGSPTIAFLIQRYLERSSSSTTISGINTINGVVQQEISKSVLPTIQEQPKKITLNMEFDVHEKIFAELTESARRKFNRDTTIYRRIGYYSSLKHSPCFHLKKLIEKSGPLDTVNLIYKDNFLLSHRTNDWIISFKKSENTLRYLCLSLFPETNGGLYGAGKYWEFQINKERFSKLLATISDTIPNNFMYGINKEWEENGYEFELVRVGIMDIKKFGMENILDELDSEVDKLKLKWHNKKWHNKKETIYISI